MFVFQHIQSSLLEVIYRNRSNLETIFRIIDRDHSGKRGCRGAAPCPVSLVLLWGTL